MAAGMFGALGALGSMGNQVAEGRQMAHEEIVRRLAEQQAQQAGALNMQATRQRIASEQSRDQLAQLAAKQPIVLGTPYVGKGGKMYQRYQDPISNAVTNKELPGDAPETEQEKLHRGLVAIGFSEQDASQAVIKKLTGKTPEKREVQPDASSPTGFSAIYYDIEGNEVWSAPTLPPRTAVPRETKRTSTDQFGNVTSSDSITKPLIGGQAGAPAGPAAPRGSAIVQGLASGQMPSATMAVANAKGLVEPGNILIWHRPAVQNADGTHSSEYSISNQDEQGREVLIPTVVNGRFLTPDGRKPPEGSDAEKAMFDAAWDHYEKTGQNLGKFDSVADADAYANVLHNRGEPAAAAPQAIVRGLASANVPPTRPLSTPSTAAPAATGGPGGQGTIAVGPYRGLDAQGQIPPRPGLNPQVAQFANDILAGRDVTKIPVKARALAESMAKQYGWKGQGSLTPAQQMQIEQVDNSLATLSDPKYLKLFDPFWQSLLMSMVPLDPTGEGGAAGAKAHTQRKWMSDDQAYYMNALTRLRGVIGGIRGFTGANNSNATADRLLAELPNFTNTKNSADALNKITRLRQEVAIIKRLGFYLTDAQSPVSAGAAADPSKPGAKREAAPAAKPKTKEEIEADRILNQYNVVLAGSQ